LENRGQGRIWLFKDLRCVSQGEVASWRGSPVPSSQGTLAEFCVEADPAWCERMRERKRCRLSKVAYTRVERARLEE
jgi:hypothetical protein